MLFQKGQAPSSHPPWERPLSGHACVALHPGNRLGQVTARWKCVPRLLPPTVPQGAGGQWGRRLPCLFYFGGSWSEKGWYKIAWNWRGKQKLLDFRGGTWPCLKACCYIHWICIHLPRHKGCRWSSVHRLLWLNRLDVEVQTEMKKLWWDFCQVFQFSTGKVYESDLQMMLGSIGGRVHWDVIRECTQAPT